MYITRQAARSCGAVRAGDGMMGRGSAIIPPGRNGGHDRRHRRNRKRAKRGDDEWVPRSPSAGAPRYRGGSRVRTKAASRDMGSLGRRRHRHRPPFGKRHVRALAGVSSPEPIPSRRRRFPEMRGGIRFGPTLVVDDVQSTPIRQFLPMERIEVASARHLGGSETQARRVAQALDPALLSAEVEMEAEKRTNGSTLRQPVRQHRAPELAPSRTQPFEARTIPYGVSRMPKRRVR